MDSKGELLITIMSRLVQEESHAGKTPYAIAKYQTEQEIPTPTGKSGVAVQRQV